MSLPCDWQTSKRKLSERRQYLLKTGRCSDCNFMVGQEPQQQTFKSHKLFLAMSSPVFETMFFGDMAEKKNDPIPIKDVKPKAFKALLKYIYMDKVKLDSFELAYGLYYCAKKYMLPSLVEKCTKYIWRNLSPKEACSAYEFAKLFEEPVLMDKCLQIICTKMDEVLKEASWEDIELRTLLKVLEQNDLQISEIKLFTALERWARSECSRKSIDPINGRSVIGNALTKIRFLNLTEKEFANGPSKSPLLTKDEAFAILMNIQCNNKTPMPEGFCTQRFSRAKSIKTHSTSMGLPGDAESSSSDEKLCDNKRDIGSQNALILWMNANFNNNNYGPKHYCIRSTIQGTNCWNSNVLRDYVNFSVDEDICVEGIQVPTQSPYDLRADTIYTEHICVRLICNGKKLTYACLTAEVKFHTLVEVTFIRPVYIQKHKVYQVGVTFIKAGYYPVIACTRDDESCGPVMFTFNRDKTLFSGSFIRSIIFTSLT